MRAALLEALRARGCSWPSPVEHHPTLASTSDRLKELAREGAPAWTVVLGDEQTVGRGRQGRTWASPRGGLYLSVLLRPSSAEASLLPLAAGVAVAEALEELGVSARLKWPNDVLLEGRKLAGILAEASSSASALDWVVLGIGVNLDAADLPEGLKEGAAAVPSRGTGGETRVALAASVLMRLTVWYDALERREASVVAAWRERSVPWWGQPVEVGAGERSLRGLARGVDERGALLLELESGATVTVLAGEARALRLAGPRERQE
jgi:BirA family transcriptional regulator, biotin operon repressor / biotin---[acetyl-CoA-carboxylase] ligase